MAQLASLQGECGLPSKGKVKYLVERIKNKKTKHKCFHSEPSKSITVEAISLEDVNVSHTDGVEEWCQEAIKTAAHNASVKNTGDPPAGEIQRVFQHRKV